MNTPNPTMEQMEENSDVYTMDEALSVVKFGKFQAFVLSYASFGLMVEAMEVMLISFIGPYVRDEWQLSSSQESFISTAIFGGMIIGSYALGAVSDNYGRRMGLLCFIAITTIPAFLSAFSPNYATLVLLRAIVGIGLGGGHVCTSWFLEFVPVHNRGVWMIIKSMSYAVGTILEASLAWVILPILGWRWLLALSSIPCIIGFFLYFLTVESPRYLYTNGRISEAYYVLTRIAVVNKTKLPSGTLAPEQTKEFDDESQDTAPLLSEMRNKTTGRKSSFLRLAVLFSPSLVKTTLLLWIVFSCNSFMYYGVVLLTSELSSGETRCRSLSGVHSNSSIGRNVFITSLAEIPGRTIAAFLVDRIGRKMSMLVMYVFSFSLLLPLVFHQSEVMMVSLLFGARVFINACLAVVIIYCPEIYPTWMRCTGAGVAHAVAKMTTMISPFIAVGLVSSCHKVAAISLFEGVLIVAAISVFFFPLETKGRDLNDIASVN